MNFMKRAILYLARKKGPTLLLFLYLVIMAVLILISFSFRNAAKKELIRLYRTLGTGFVLKIDTENPANVEVIMDEEGHPDSTYIGTKITNETIEKIMEIDGVTNYTLPREYNLAWTDLKLRPGLWTKTEPDGMVLTKEYIEIAKQTILAYCCRDGEFSKNFRTGALEIIKGRNLQDGDKFRTVISEELAERNGLFIGDTITIEVKEGTYQRTKELQKTWGVPIELEIVGIFHMNFTQQYSELTVEKSYMENNIYVDTETSAKIDKIIEDNWEGELIDIGYTEVIFFVDNPEKTDAIIQEIEERNDINIDSLLVYPDQTAYTSSAKPYHQIYTFSYILSVIGIGGTGIILFLLMKLFVRGRIHEIGVLLSIGIKKRKIIAQLLTESLLVSVLAISFVILLSSPLVNFFTKAAEQITTPTQKEESYRISFRDGIYPEMEKVSYDKVMLSNEVTPQIILQLVGLVSGISAAGILLASIQIVEIEPETLMKLM